MDFLHLTELILKRLINAQTIAVKLGSSLEICNEISSQIEFIESFRIFFINNEEIFPIHYMNNIYYQLREYFESLPIYDLRYDVSPSSTSVLEDHFIGNMHGFANNVFSSLKFTLSFFKQLNYLTSNMVLLGANGSGKSSLAAQLKNHLNSYSLVISAQKLLFIPEFENISNPQNTNLALQNQQTNFNYSKWTFSANTHFSSISFIHELAEQFKNLIDNLLAERSQILLSYIENVRSGKISDSKSNIPETKLDKVIKIWNRLFQHRELYCKHSNIVVRIKDLSEDYEANHMSDGEKVALYYIAQILQAPKNSLIIIDEPEMYLHKTILNKLWDTLESERNDCKFLYLTHDIDFAIARSDAKKFWVRSFQHPNEWDISEIENTEDLPENLLLELVGSRKNILFCEGEVGKNDDEIYKILFPNFTIKPVGSCINVINFTRAFNKIHNRTTQAFGLIDSDHSPTNRLERLKEDMIFSLEVAEIENLLLDEDLLKIVVHNSPVDYSQEIIDRIKNTIISALEEDIENQAASFISNEIDFYFKEANIREGRTKSAIESNFQSFVASIQINDKYNERVNKLKEVIDQKKYLEVLKVYNNKGLMAKTHNILEIKSYKKLAIKQLKLNQEARECLKKHFPEALLHAGIHTT
ncbi:ATP-binding protein [Acinetobacter baumannii]|nr:ATP-binding protein [Acinetobacter baumannii]MDC5201542.1 ATP-binding protein [Acinetobacter baumannii]